MPRTNDLYIYKCLSGVASVIRFSLNGIALVVRFSLNGVASVVRFSLNGVALVKFSLVYSFLYQASIVRKFGVSHSKWP